MAENKPNQKTMDLNDNSSPAKKKRLLTVINTETGEIEARVNLRTNHYGKSWAAAFPKNFDYLATNLNGEQLRVLMFLMSKLDFGNYIRVTNKTIAKSIGMMGQNVTRAIRGLIDKNIIAVDEVFGVSRIYRLNPAYMYKGKGSAIYSVYDEYAKLRVAAESEKAAQSENDEQQKTDEKSKTDKKSSTN